jgi:hypothetical protein
MSYAGVRSNARPQKTEVRPIVVRYQIGKLQLEVADHVPAGKAALDVLGDG